MKTIGTIAAAFMAVLTGASNAFAAELPIGTWHMVDSYCTNPDYKYSPDEQAMRDAVRHVGNMWTDDDIVMTSATVGTWATGWTDNGLGCTSIQDMAVTYDSANRVTLKFSNGRMSDRTPPTNDVEISCGAKEDAVESYDFEITPAGFDFILGESADCGQYRFKFVAWP